MVAKELIYAEFDELCTKYKKLLPPEQSGEWWKIDGEFDVVDSSGYIWDTYGIRILLPPGFPYDLPILIETSNKIEPSEEWHNSKGGCCLATEAIIYNALGTPISLLMWMTRFVHDYLANHVVKKKENSYANGEYPHGVEGVLVGYKEIFGLNTDVEVLWWLGLLCGALKLRRNDLCFCGSGRKYKRCFLENPEGHRKKVPVSLLDKDRLAIANWLQRERENK